MDFAYSVHTDLGHRCRGARVDGVLVPLNTALASGQTVEITSAKEGGPSMDWLNADLGYLKSQRSRAKVRAWFNAQALQATIARGRELVEKLLQREGRTAQSSSTRWPSNSASSRPTPCSRWWAKTSISLRNDRAPAQAQPEPPAPDEGIDAAAKPPKSDGRGGVLVVGVESLLTSLAKCCRPAPPDAIGGFVTRGKGVGIHRRDCSNFRHMAEAHRERVIEVEWGQPETRPGREALYPLDVSVEGADRPALLRDVSEVFAKEKMNVMGVNTQSTRDADGRTARMTFTVETTDAARLKQVLAQVARIRVRAKRK